MHFPCVFLNPASRPTLNFTMLVLLTFNFHTLIRTLTRDTCINSGSVIVSTPLVAYKFPRKRAKEPEVENDDDNDDYDAQQPAKKKRTSKSNKGKKRKQS